MHITLENPTIRVVLESGLEIAVINNKSGNFVFEFMKSDRAGISSADVDELETLTALLTNRNESSFAIDDGSGTITDDDVDVIFT
tara:strand:+ start:41 stop:295 length:255 start_codon:yes stop_codon:yes gene_type:complete